MNIKQLIFTFVTKSFSVGFILIGGVIFVNLPSVYKSEMDFQAKAKRTTGVITKTITEERQVYSTNGSYRVTDLISTVTLVINQGKQINFTSQICEKLLFTSIKSDIGACNGKKVVVLYDPDNPTNARVDTGETPLGVVTRHSFYASFFLLMGTVYFFMKDSEQPRPRMSE